MTALRSLLAILGARWFWSLLGAVILSLLLWFYGDLVAIGDVRPLEGQVQRLLAILGIALLWGGWNVFAMARARRSNEQLVSALAGPAREAPGAGELAELDRRFAGALEQLRRSRVGRRGNRRWLYELPWYVMIGPPGSGKSTAIAQSGLRLRLGKVEELRGTGGTRYCDWIFTDEAVLLDTAGRYTTQDSDPEVDQAAWLGFLDLLRERRPRQPLSGVLVALSVRDLLEGSADHAARIRGRLEEVEQRLGLRLPVYLLVTKADLIAGFEGFFDDLSEQEREQVWGHTFEGKPRPGAAAPAGAPDAAAIRAAFAALVARLDRRVPDRLAAEPDLDRRARIFGFPAQVASVAEEVARFAERCFAPSSYERGGWLRGVYLTSGTQTGTQIDRLMAAVAQSIGAATPAAPATGGDRSFFLRHLLEQVVFGEASLAGRDPARERRAQRLRGAALAGIALATLGGLGALVWSYSGNLARQQEIEAELAAWTQAARPVARANLAAADADLTPVLPLLDRLAGLRDRLAAGDPAWLRLGLSQSATEEAQLAVAYRNALADLLLPRLVLLAERGLRGGMQDADATVERLKLYLAAGGAAPVDAARLAEYAGLEAEARAPQAGASARRHVAALAALLPELDRARLPALDAGLVAQARAAIARVPLARRAYTLLVSDPAVTALPGWRLTEAAGPNAAFTLVRRSGRPLGTPIPAILTHDGFHQVFLAQLDEVARGAWAEYWVVSGRGAPEASDAEIRQLKADMLRLYYDDAVAAWDGLLRDVALAPLGSLPEAVEATKALSGPNSPLKLLVQAVVRETSLTVPPQPAGEQKGDQKPGLPAALARAGGGLDRLARLVRPAAASAAPAEVPGAPVEARFAYLRQLVQAGDGGTPPIDEVLQSLAALHGRLADAAAAPNPAEALARTGSATTQMALVARRLPDPLRGMLDGVQSRVGSMGRAGARQQINAAWQADVLPFCRNAIGRRFPFAPGSPTDATIEDIGRIFGPGGLIDGFVKTQLAPFVDTTRQPWRDVQEVGLPASALAQLARARRITGALFAAGAGPKAAFNLTPLSLDAKAASVTLDLDGQELRYAHGPARPTPFTWPGPGGANLVRLSFAPVGGGPPVTILREGPWALFRLLQAGRLQPTDQPDVFEAELGAGGYSLQLRLRAASVENPFDLRLLSGFACPEGL